MGNKKALVTGASDGIGRSLAESLAIEGYDVTAVARNENNLKSLIEKLGAGHKYLVADLSQATGVSTVANELKNNKYDLLINNAGFGVFGTFEKIDLQKYMNLLKVNVDAVVQLSHAFLQNAKDGDALINVASVLGLTGFPYGAVYSASKAFVVNFTESLWSECKDRGIYVMALCPGATSTSFHTASGASEKAVPPAAITQTPEQVADETICALKSRKSPTVVSGYKNRMQGFIASRILGRKVTVSMMGKFGSIHKN